MGPYNIREKTGPPSHCQRKWQTRRVGGGSGAGEITPRLQGKKVIDVCLQNKTIRLQRGTTKGQLPKGTE